MLTQKQLLTGLETIRRNHCAYLTKDPFKSRCDCKFGVSNESIVNLGENGNGCPELRFAIAVISRLSNSEFTQLQTRRLPFNKDNQEDKKAFVLALLSFYNGEPIEPEKFVNKVLRAQQLTDDDLFTSADEISEIIQKLAITDFSHNRLTVKGQRKAEEIVRSIWSNKMLREDLEQLML